MAVKFAARCSAEISVQIFTYLFPYCGSVGSIVNGGEFWAERFERCGCGGSLRVLRFAQDDGKSRNKGKSKGRSRSFDCASRGEAARCFAQDDSLGVGANEADDSFGGRGRRKGFVLRTDAHLSDEEDARRWGTQ